MKTEKKVNKNDYEMYEFLSGYYGICKKHTYGGGCVFGGDPSCIDHYNEEFIESVFEQWDGSLVYTGETYGFQIFN
jgi:hypothetical protein